ncbi:MAG: DUF362 domain-containing protein [Firmicutes bacterium]|nr:DUF362 domain-containing protein [Bacillota bacterium]
MAIVRCGSYSPAEVERAVRTCAELGDFRPRPGTKVLVKPNMLVPADPRSAITTHPEFVRAVIHLLKDCGAEVTVGDSPGFLGCRQVARLTGIADVCRRAGARLASFNDPAALRDAYGAVCTRFEVAREVLEADLVVSLPKLKTHGLMRLTCAVKNMLGCVPGLGKQRLHALFQDPERFGAMLVDLCRAVRPAMTFVDAVTAMEGNGPRNGRPRFVGLVLGSTDPYALDVVASDLVGINPASVPTVAAAHRAGLGPLSPAETPRVGVDPSEVRVADFRQAPLRRMERGPSPLRSLIRDYLIPRPEISAEKCRACLVCGRVCPAGAIGARGDRVRVDYSACIRCYCCDEVCPHGAIQLKVPLYRMFR